MATEHQRVPQNACPTCRSKIVILRRGDALAYEATFIAQPGVPRPPTV